MRSRWFFILALACAGSGLSYAHHFLVANYYFDRTVTVHGKVDEFLLRNPHSYLRVDALDRNQHREMWLIEWSSGGQLGRAGISEDTLKPGDEVDVTGNPSRIPTEHKMHMVTIVRPSDQWRWNQDDN
jgi:hypothetical protein